MESVPKGLRKGSNRSGNGPNLKKPNKAKHKSNRLRKTACIARGRGHNDLDSASPGGSALTEWEKGKTVVGQLQEKGSENFTETLKKNPPSTHPI